MSTAEITLNNLRYSGKLILGFKYVPFIMLITLIMVLSIFYVWPHIRMTELEYQIAEEMGIKQRLLEEQEKLKIEYATLKSPQRIESIARDKMQMIYPAREQVIYIK